MWEKLFQKQLIMRRVVGSLLVLLVFSTYLFGARVLIINALVLALGIATEWVFERSRGKKVSEAVLVTCLLYGLSLPPMVPLWIAAIGIVFAVAVAKEMFGGFGRNIFNPAIAGRLFVYISFPLQLQQTWATPNVPGFLQGFFGMDVTGSATPLAVMARDGAGSLDFWQMFFGFRLGSIGETASWLIIAAAIYLIVTKTAQWRLIVSTFFSALALHAALYAAGISDLVPHFAMISGSILYVSVFMSTDPVSAPNKPASQWLYGILIGSVTVLVRVFAGFPEGTSFGVLIGNTFASLIDELMPKPKPKKRKPASTQASSRESSTAGAANAESNAKPATTGGKK